MQTQFKNNLFVPIVEKFPYAFVIHQDEKVVYLNLQMARMVGGHSPDQFIGKSIWEFVPNNEKEMIEGRMSKISEFHHFDNSQHSLITLENKKIKVNSYGTSVEWNGRPAFQSIIREVSEDEMNTGSMYFIFNAIEETIIPIINDLKEIIPVENYDELAFCIKTISNMKPNSVFKKLSTQELRVCCFIKQGLSTDEIRKKMHIDKSTIDTYRRRIRKKLGLINSGKKLSTYFEEISHII